MTAYVVTSGQYSDYHIVAVFLDEEAATQFVNEYNATQDRSWNHYYVENHEVS